MLLLQVISHIQSIIDQKIDKLYITYRLNNPAGLLLQSSAAADAREAEVCEAEAEAEDRAKDEHRKRSAVKMDHSEQRDSTVAGVVCRHFFLFMDAVWDMDSSRLDNWDLHYGDLDNL